MKHLLLIIGCVMLVGCTFVPRYYGGEWKDIPQIPKRFSIHHEDGKVTLIKCMTEVEHIAKCPQSGLHMISFEDEEPYMEFISSL